MEKSLGFNLLTTIELKCLRGVAEAKLELEIGSECKLSPAEVSFIISTAIIKLNCPNRVAAIAKAARLGLLQFDEKLHPQETSTTFASRCLTRAAKAFPDE